MYYYPEYASNPYELMNRLWRQALEAESSGSRVKISKIHSPENLTRAKLASKKKKRKRKRHFKANSKNAAATVPELEMTAAPA